MRYLVQTGDVVWKLFSVRFLNKYVRTERVDACARKRERGPFGGVWEGNVPRTQ